MSIHINIWSVLCVKFISIFLPLVLEKEDADCASTLTDIDLAKLEISLESLFISVISAKPFHGCAKQIPPD